MSDTLSRLVRNAADESRYAVPTIASEALRAARVGDESAIRLAGKALVRSCGDWVAAYHCVADLGIHLGMLARSEDGSGNTFLARIDGSQQTEP